MIAVRINPASWKEARIAALYADKSLGQWLEEAISEKIEGEKKRKEGRK